MLRGLLRMEGSLLFGSILLSRLLCTLGFSSGSRFIGLAFFCLLLYFLLLGRNLHRGRFLWHALERELTAWETNEILASLSETEFLG